MHMPGKLFAHNFQFLGKAFCASGVHQDTQENGHTHTHSPQIMPSTRQTANGLLRCDLWPPQWSPRPPPSPLNTRTLRSACAKQLQIPSAVAPSWETAFTTVIHSPAFTVPSRPCAVARALLLALKYRMKAQKRDSIGSGAVSSTRGVLGMSQYPGGCGQRDLAWKPCGSKASILQPPRRRHQVWMVQTHHMHRFVCWCTGPA
jgi:hypothetical protein